MSFYSFERSQIYVVWDWQTDRLMEGDKDRLIYQPIISLTTPCCVIFMTPVGNSASRLGVLNQRCGIWRLLKVRGYLTPYLVLLFHPKLTGWRNALPKESPKRNIQKEKIETDKRRKLFFHTFLYLLGEGTNRCYVPRRSMVPKTSKWCCWFDGHCVKEKDNIVSFFSFYACIISFSVRDLWEFLQI